MKKKPFLWILLVAAGCGWVVHAQNQAPPVPEKKAAKAPPAAAQPKPTARKKAELAAVALEGETLSLKDEETQRDFPAICRDAEGTLWFVFVSHDGENDTLRIGKKTESGLEEIATLSDPGVIHQPAIAVDGSGALWAIWGQTGSDDVVSLMARSWKDGERGELVVLADSDGADSFADAGTDPEGRVWVTWQSMRAGEGDVFARFFDPGFGGWSQEIPVADAPGGDWEPRVAFAGGATWVVYDSSRGNEFNLYLAKVDAEGGVDTVPIAHSPRYEARPEIAADGEEGLWIAAERGRVRWGLDVRGHDNAKGLNAQKEVLFGRYDLERETFEEIPLGPAGEAGAPVNLPALGVDAEGNPWVAYRYYETNRWQIAVTWLNQETGEWHSRRRLPDSSMGQDRRAAFVRDAEGSLWLNWPSDLRIDKTCLVSGVFLAKFDRSKPFAPASPPSGAPKDLTGEPYAASQSTPERPPHQKHQWTHEGETYTLVWGDLHRHTDVSNCRTGFDGCIVEQFRYAYDLAKLDFLGTSDHTDIRKIYDPYEWWHNQRLHDVFHAPEQFTSLYVYEREQRWPWGHRNVVFAQRGGPIVYIQRKNYRSSPWQELYPVEANPLKTEIDPPELWRVLTEYGEPVAIVSHTGATGMGTDWGRYDEAPIDHSIENLVEIFQGARVSYEGKGAPQPTAGLRPDEKYTANSDGTPPPPPAPIESFGKFDAGVYQNALQLGLRLGVFASSDHISQHVSYGGVYVKDFTREGIIEGFQARRTVAATDKIYVEFVCNGEPLGSIFETGDAPTLTISVDGTARLKRVTLVRNETNYQVWEEIEGNTFQLDYTDEKPIKEEESRYYLRVEQEDGNMAWSSPVWVTVKK